MKKLMATIFCASMAVSMLAQTSAIETKAENKSFWSNCFVSVAGGTQIYFGDHDPQADLGDRLAPALDIAVGKWFNPVLGARLVYSGLQAKGATQTWGAEGVHDTGKPVPGKHEHAYGFLNESKFKMGNLHADLLVNCSNWFCGYNETRLYNCSPYVGLGWAFVYDEPTTNKLTFNAGLLNSFRINDALQANFDVRAMYVGDSFDGEKGGHGGEGMLTFTVGLTYNFKLRAW